MKIEKLAILLVLIAAAGFPIMSAKVMGCIDDGLGSYYCPEEVAVLGLEGKLLEDITCIVAENSTKFNGCYTSIEFTKSKDIEIPFLKVSGEFIEENTAQDVKENFKIEPGYYLEAYIDPYLITQSKCILDENSNYNCGNKGKEALFGGTILMDNAGVMFFVYSMEEKPNILNFITANWIYILLVLVAVAVVYSIIKKKR